MSGFDGFDERGVFVDDDAAGDGRLKRQTLNRRVSMKLDVFSRPVQKVQQTVDQLVLADALKAR